MSSGDSNEKQQEQQDLIVYSLSSSPQQQHSNFKYPIQQARNRNTFDLLEDQEEVEEDQEEEGGVGMGVRMGIGNIPIDANVNIGTSTMTSESDKENVIHDEDDGQDDHTNDDKDDDKDHDEDKDEDEDDDNAVVGQINNDNADSNVNDKFQSAAESIILVSPQTQKEEEEEEEEEEEAGPGVGAEIKGGSGMTQELSKSTTEPVVVQEQEQEKFHVPFSHPSSPISQQNTSLLSLQKDFDFDQSLALDDHDVSLLLTNNNNSNSNNSNTTSTAARKKRKKQNHNHNHNHNHKLDNYISHNNSNNNNNYNYNSKNNYIDDNGRGGDGDDLDQVESTFDSSYVSFPPSTNTHNNSILGGRRRAGSGSGSRSIVSASTTATSFATSAYSISTALSLQRSERGGGIGGMGPKKERRRRPRPWDDVIDRQKNMNSSNNTNELIMNQSISTATSSVDDNYSNKDDNKDKEDNDIVTGNIHYHYNDDLPKGERTPLLLTNATSMHSAKTCKRNNTNINVLMAASAAGNYDHQQQQQFKNHCHPSSSSLSFESNGHLHTDAQYGSINNAAMDSSAANTVSASTVPASPTYSNKYKNTNNATTNTNGSGGNTHKTDNNEHEMNMDYQYTTFYNSHNKNHTTPSSYVDAVDDDNVQYPSIFHQYYHQLRRCIADNNNNNNYQHDSPIITTVITYLTMSHFMLMALYNTFIHYKLHRLGHTEQDISNNAATGASTTPPYWISYVGRVYNPAIGPDVQTLILFGVFHPVLIVGDVVFDYDTDNEDYNYNNNGDDISSAHSYINQNYDTSGEWWRFGISAICCTSMVQIVCNVFILTFLNGRERDIGSWNVLLTFSLSVLCGGFFSIVSTYGLGSWSFFDFNYGSSYPGGDNKDNDNVIQITGLNCAGIMGVVTLLLTKMMLFGRDHDCYDDQRYDDLLLTANTDNNYYEERHGYNNNDTSKPAGTRRRRRKGSNLTFGQRLKTLFSSCSFPQMAFGLELLNGLLLPYTSFSSMIGGAAMGVCCGLFLYSPGLSPGWGNKSIGSTGDGGSWTTNRYWNDNDSQSSSLASDLEEAFSPDMSTPPRKSIFGVPPPAPFSSSSKGLDTPVMRRSIIKSPDEDEDEIDTIRNLNKPGFTGEGLKQRNISKREERRSNHSVSSNSKMYSSKQMGRFQRIQHWGNQRRWLQFLGVLFGICSLTLPVLYIGYFLEPINGQAVQDSLYGCKTLHGFYQYAETDDAGENRGDGAEMDDNVQATEHMKSAISGDIVCTEICVPLSLVRSAMNNNEDMNLQSGTCLQQEYECLTANDSISINGKFDIDGDIYVEGSCATTTTSEQ